MATREGGARRIAGLKSRPTWLKRTLHLEVARPRILALLAPRMKSKYASKSPPFSPSPVSFFFFRGKTPGETREREREKKNESGEERKGVSRFFDVDHRDYIVAPYGRFENACPCDATRRETAPTRFLPTRGDCTAIMRSFPRAVIIVRSLGFTERAVSQEKQSESVAREKGD